MPTTPPIIRRSLRVVSCLTMIMPNELELRDDQGAIHAADLLGIRLITREP
jgi:hypothetical protein